MPDLREIVEAVKRQELCPACNGNRHYTFAGKTVFCTVCQKGKALKVMVKQ